jgi:hypothetical protein
MKPMAAGTKTPNKPLHSILWNGTSRGRPAG